MNTPRRPIEENNEIFENSGFSSSHHFLETQIERLKNRNIELETLNAELKQKLEFKQLILVDFTQRMNRVTEMKIKENQKELDFLQEKIQAFEEIIPANVSKTLEMTDNILRVTYSKSKTEIEKKIGDMERRIAKLSENLKTYRKNAKKIKKIVSGAPPFENKLIEALENFRNRLKPDQPRSDDLVYMDGWDFKINLPLENFKKCVFSMLQAQEIVKAFHEGFLNKYIHLKSNAQNFQSIIEIFPKYFKLPENSELVKRYKEIIAGLKEFNVCLQTKCPLQMKTESFLDLKDSQGILIKVIELHTEVMDRADEIQKKINSLFEEIRKFIKDIYVKTKDVRGAEITHNLA